MHCSANIVTAGSEIRLGCGDAELIHYGVCVAGFFSVGSVDVGVICGC